MSLVLILYGYTYLRKKFGGMAHLPGQWIKLKLYGVMRDFTGDKHLPCYFVLSDYVKISLNI